MRVFGLPKATELSKPLPKKAIFDKFRPSIADRRAFDEQIARMAIVAEISPQTVSIAAGADVTAIFAILVTLKTPECDKRNIATLSKMIDQHMLFALQYGDLVQLAVCRAGKVLMSERKPLATWRLSLSGLDIGAVWESIIATVGGIDLQGGRDLDASIAEADWREKLLRQIATLEERAMNERQPRRKWAYANQVKKLKEQVSNG